MRTLFYLASFLLAFALVTGCDSSGTNTESLGDSTAVAFTQSTVVAPEDTGSVNLTLEIRDPGFKEFSFSVAVDESQSTATLGEDVTGPADTTITFPQSTTAGETAQLSYSVVDDSEFLEGDETLVVTVSSGDGASPGETSTFALTIEENDLVLPIADAREREGESVAVEGTVTRAFGDFVRLQDESGPTGASALYVRQTSGDFKDDVADGTIAPGTELRVAGTIGEFNGNIQINEEDLTSYTVQGQGDVPAPQDVSLAEISENGEDYEGELIRVAGLEFPDATGSFSNGTSYDVETDGSTTLTFRVQGDTETTLAGETIPSNRFTYTGVVGEFNGSYQLIPIRPSDLDVAQGIEAARTAGAGETVTVTGTITRAFGDFARIQDNSDGGDPSAIYIRQTSGPFFDDVDDGTIEAGTEVSLTGTIGEFNGNLQINNEDLLVYNVVGQGATPTPQSVTLAELVANGEEYEAELVEVTSVEFTSATGTFANSQSYDVEDPSVTESFTFRVQSESETAIGGESTPSDPFTYTGVVGEFQGSYQLIPILPSDIQE